MGAFVAQGQVRLWILVSLLIVCSRRWVQGALTVKVPARAVLSRFMVPRFDMFFAAV